MIESASHPTPDDNNPGEEWASAHDADRTSAAEFAKLQQDLSADDQKTIEKLMQLKTYVQAPDAQIVDETALEEDQAASEPDSAPINTDLTDIPGIGPVMKHRLLALGIDDIAILAAQNPADLRLKLGDVSELLDVESWVLHAQGK